MIGLWAIFEVDNSQIEVYTEMHYVYTVYYGAGYTVHYTMCSIQSYLDNIRVTWPKQTNISETDSIIIINILLFQNTVQLK